MASNVYVDAASDYQVSVQLYRPYYFVVDFYFIITLIVGLGDFYVRHNALPSWARCICAAVMKSVNLVEFIFINSIVSSAN